ncbi:MAG: cellulase family glycosylhydrolase [Chloroflexota bacterium]
MRNPSVRTVPAVVLLVLLSISLGCGGRTSGTPDQASSPPVSPVPPRIYLPGVSREEAATVPSPLPTPTREPQRETEVPQTPTPTPLPPPVAKPGYGVQLHIPPRWEMEQTLRWAQGLGVGWIKEQVQWHTVEHGPDDFDWQNLDRVVAGADRYGFSILLSVTRAPDWTRDVELEGGPPADYAQFGRFMEQLAGRYRGRVHAYELWNEPNLAREWRGDTLDAARFASLVAEGARGVRAADPDAIVVSGAPAVTGIDDGEMAIDDRAFLRGMLEAGIADHVDAIGAHPYGYANPPEESWEDETHVATSHNDHPSFFFRDTLEHYRQIMLAYEVEGHQIWVTEFGWASPEGIGEMDLTGWEYGSQVTEAQQADYVVRAFHMGDERPWVGPMFLWNLNLATIWGPDDPFSAYSLLRPDGSYRPAYVALRLAAPLEP